MMSNLSTFVKDNRNKVYHIGTQTGGGWCMIGTKKDLNQKEHKRAQAEKFLRENKAETRKEEIIQLVREDKLLLAAARIRFLLKSMKTTERVLRAIPKYSEWKNRLVLNSFPLIEPNHIGLICEGTEQGMYWERKDYMNETPMEDKEE